MAVFIDADVSKGGSYEPSYQKDLGVYTFSVESTATETGQKIKAICHNGKTGLSSSMAREFARGTQLAGWYVVANDTTADVYAVLASAVDGKHIEFATPVRIFNNDLYYASGDLGNGWKFATRIENSGAVVRWNGGVYLGVNTSVGGVALVDSTGHGEGYSGNHYDKYYRGAWGGFYSQLTNIPITTNDPHGISIDNVGVSGTHLIARFSIDLHDAGGTVDPALGGGGGWTQPGDWNPVPTTTLHLTVSGALSGRHNDPMNDPSYSYVPAENTAQAGYGCGGDGGHGGGGGGGASTVITEQFATNKANSKIIVVTVKRHGYGSGGSKGAKGGDGCILIYY